MERVKERELRGYSYEAADASFELLLREELLRDGAEGRPRNFFTTESWRAIVENRPDGSHANEATVKLWAKGERIVSTAEGNGPVNALDRALRLALERIYPELAQMELVDYKVRILAGTHGTESTTRVLVSTGDGGGEWSTVGVADNVIAASWQALVDAYTYGLLRAGLSSPRADRPSRHAHPGLNASPGVDCGNPTVHTGGNWGSSLV
ncbi:hypothetical protein LUW77_22680 [Streptomyces radiopugnans]|nr:hypothetical protein LUW77_22680 [Streptomyces radiopugnans]